MVGFIVMIKVDGPPFTLTYKTIKITIREERVVGVGAFVLFVIIPKRLT